jgi:hypothetical protein
MRGANLNIDIVGLRIEDWQLVADPRSEDQAAPNHDDDFSM